MNDAVEQVMAEKLAASKHLDVKKSDCYAHADNDPLKKASEHI